MKNWGKEDYLKSMWLKEFKKIGLEMEDGNEIVLKILDLLPTEIKQETPFKNPLGSEMLYTFSNPLKVSSSDVHCFGENQIKYLYLALRTAIKHLTPAEIHRYITKINDISKHQNFLFEMRPILNLRADLKAQYESHNNCKGNNDIDWEIQNGEYTILLEVKNRIKSTINHLAYCLELPKKLKAGIAPESIPPPKVPDPADLFKSVMKCNDQKDSKTLQGVWVSSGIIENEKKLNECFDNIASKKIQFAIFSGWDENEAYILVKDELYRPILLDYFSLIESNDFVSRKPNSDWMN